MFAICNCIDLSIYNQEGEKVLSIDYLNRAKIIEDFTCAHLLLEYEISDFKLLELMYNKSGTDKKSDFQKDLGEVRIAFGKKRNDNYYKGIGRFTVLTEDNKEEEVKLVFNKLTFSDTDRRRTELLNMDFGEFTKFKTDIVICLDDEDNYFTLVK